jgi:hypothetical protein
MGETALPVAVGSEPRIAERVAARPRVAAIPWYVWCFAAAVTSDAFGGYWDISWHISVGRDTFWTPAHMMASIIAAPDGSPMAASGVSAKSVAYRKEQGIPIGRPGL